MEKVIQKGGSIMGQMSDAFQRARAALRKGELDRAESILSAMPQDNAERYYLRGLLHMRIAAYDAARENIVKAYELEPDHPLYAEAMENMIEMRHHHHHHHHGHHGHHGGGSSICSVCGTLYCMDCCCESMGGDCIPCC